jgi:hypothetical protein
LASLNKEIPGHAKMQSADDFNKTLAFLNLTKNEKDV